ncbi:hypothetical protein [Rhodopila sp.]|uniref:hypothetical protein n=1 Tax=Rhodopila sp. TaxID=2480087 RepID=UPI003D14218F
MLPFIQISKPSDIDKLIAEMARLEKPHRVELLRSVRQHETNLVELGRTADAPTRELERSLRPTIVLLGDDDYSTTGPIGWTAFRRLGYWARGAMVHATGGDVASYRLAIELALTKQRFLLIETSSAHAHEWGAALHKRNIPAIGLLPPAGVHPLPMARSEMQ